MKYKKYNVYDHHTFGDCTFWYGRSIHLRPLYVSIEFYNHLDSRAHVQFHILMDGV